LVGWWPLDGAANDLVNGNSLALSGTSNFVPGRVGQAFQFDGASAYGTAAASSALDVGLGDGFSIELWVNPADVTYRPIVEYSPRSGVAGVHFWIGVYGSGSLFANLIDVNGSSHSWRSDTDIVVSNAWQHVAMSYHKSSGLLRFYLNGTKVTEHNLGTFAPQTSYPILVGYRPNENARFIGAMDELSLYNRALADSEVQAIAGAGTEGKCRTNTPPPPPPPTPATFDLSRDYSLAANPNGPWSYGYLTALNGTFGLLGAARTFNADNGVPIAVWELNTFQLPAVAKVLGPGTAHSDGDHFTAEPGTVYFAPGADGAPHNFGVARFTVPPGAGGTYRLESSVRSLFDNTRSRDSDFHVARNGVELFGQFLPPNSRTGYTNILTLSAGDTVDFVIGRGPDGLTFDTGLKIQATLSATTNAAPPPPPAPVIEQLVALVNSAPDPVNREPLLATLDAVRASLARGNLRAAINQLRAFQNKVQAQVAPLDSALAAQLIALAGQLIESLDPDGARRADLAALAGMPMRVERVFRVSGGGTCVEACAIPGTACCVQISTHLRDWVDIAPPVEVADGLFQFLEARAAEPARFYRLKAR